MTPEQKAKEIVEKYMDIINETDFHIPEFVTGVSMKSEKYKDVLAEETLDLAKACSIEEVKAVIKAFDEANAYDLLPSIEYYERLINEIEKL